MKPGRHLALLHVAAALASGFPAQHSHAYESRDVRIIDGANKITELDFWSGFSLFRDPWEVAGASTKGRDGLGPLFNARACSACHRHAGPSAAAHGDTAPVKIPLGLVARLTANIPANAAAQYSGDAYGKQLQPFSVEPQKIASEGQLAVTFVTRTVAVGNDSITLHEPQWRIEHTGYGAITADTILSVRIAPALYGMGLIEAIPAAAITVLADPDDRNGDGISGVTGTAGDGTPRRFGWQAEQGSIVDQSASAFWNDIGITSRHFHQQNCQPLQTTCRKARTGANAHGLEITDSKLAAVALFVQLLAAPDVSKNSSPQPPQGQKIFSAIGCDNCHHREYKTQSAVATLNNQTITPYSDFLLHDMGEALSDRRIDGKAVATQWRTAPLWGLSKRLQQKKFGLLHDGRARSIAAAVLWHDGEASAARERFTSLSDDNRRQLIHFVEQL